MNASRRYRSRDYGSDPALVATVRLVENLAELMPAVRSHAHAEITLVDGNPARLPGSVEPPTTVRARPVGGRCCAAVPAPCSREVYLVDDAGAPLMGPDGLVMIDACGNARPCAEHDSIDYLATLELVDCGRPRPCPDHDSPIDMTSVERAVEQRLRIERHLDDLEQQCKSIATLAKQALDSARRLVGTRLAAEQGPRQCRDGQQGKDGTIEWGDVLCVAPSEKSGLCSKHYMAWYRWRKANDIDVDGMFAEAGHVADL